MTVESRDNRALIKVCDDGPGIDEIEQKRIFEPFYQARTGKCNHGSIGLGLSLVRKIAHQHHGNVRYVSEHQDGACFEVSLRQDQTIAVPK